MKFIRVIKADQFEVVPEGNEFEILNTSTNLVHTDADGNELTFTDEDQAEQEIRKIKQNNDSKVINAWEDKSIQVGKYKLHPSFKDWDQKDLDYYEIEDEDGNRLYDENSKYVRFKNEQDARKYVEDRTSTFVNSLDNLLAKVNKTKQDIDKVYKGKDHYCRCGCGGTYYEPPSNRVLINIDKVLKNDNFIDLAYWMDGSVPRINISLSGNQAYTIYFK